MEHLDRNLAVLIMEEPVNGSVLNLCPCSDFWQQMRCGPSCNLEVYKSKIIVVAYLESQHRHLSQAHKFKQEF